MKRYHRAAVAFLYLAGCLSVLFTSLAASADVRGTVVWYLEREVDGEPFKVRYIVTPDYLRSDEGGNDEGYVLFLRKRKHIYNVVPENRTILEIDGDGVLPRPTSVSIEIKQAVDNNAPSLEGKAALILELLADKELCRSAVVVPGLLDDMREALGEFQRALAVQQQRTLNSTPEEFRTPCFMASYIYSPDYHLHHGIPLLEWNAGVLKRELVDYQSGVELSETLFELPESYRYFSAPGP